MRDQHVEGGLLRRHVNDAAGANQMQIERLRVRPRARCFEQLGVQSILGPAQLPTGSEHTLDQARRATYIYMSPGRRSRQRGARVEPSWMRFIGEMQRQDSFRSERLQLRNKSGVFA